MKFKIIKLKKVTSTNEVAIDLIKSRKKRIGCILAESQTRGKGTRGKKWVSNKGNLYTSIFFPLKKNYPPFHEFSIINPIIIASIIQLFCKRKTVSFKWPNDVFVNKKKICGILQELIYVKNKKFLIIGIGLNIFSKPNLKEKYKATCITLESQKKTSISKIIRLLIKAYENFFLNLKTYNYDNFKRKTETMSLK